MQLSRGAPGTCFWYFCIWEGVSAWVDFLFPSDETYIFQPLHNDGPGLDINRFTGFESIIIGCCGLNNETIRGPVGADFIDRPWIHRNAKCGRFYMFKRPATTPNGVICLSIYLRSQNLCSCRTNGETSRINDIMLITICMANHS